MAVIPEELEIDERDRDDFIRALNIIRTYQSASPSLLRRELGLRLLHIMKFLDVMESAGLVGPYQSIYAPRPVYLPKSGGH